MTVKSPTNGRGLMNYGLTLMARGDYPAAIGYFERALVFTPDYPLLHVNLGIAYGGAKRAAEAERAFQRAQALAPDDWRTHYYLARWLGDNGRPAEAEAAAARAVELNAADEESSTLLARLKAASVTTAAGAAADGHVEESLASYRAGQFREALASAQAALRLRPDYAAAWNNAAAAHIAMGEYDQGIVAAETALRLDPGLQIARNNLAYAVEQKARRSAAAREPAAWVTAGAVVLVVPAYNPTGGLPDLIGRILAASPAPFAGAVVVDDGSAAAAQPVFAAVEAIQAVVVLRRPANGGKGTALKDGFRAAIDRWPAAIGVTTADADGQHDPSDVTHVARTLVEPSQSPGPRRAPLRPHRALAEPAWQPDGSGAGAARRRWTLHRYADRTARLAPVSGLSQPPAQQQWLRLRTRCAARVSSDAADRGADRDHLPGWEPAQPFPSRARLAADRARPLEASPERPNPGSGPPSTLTCEQRQRPFRLEYARGSCHGTSTARNESRGTTAGPMMKRHTLAGPPGPAGGNAHAAGDQMRQPPIAGRGMCPLLCPPPVGLGAKW